jgi:hypothetical protein
MGMEDETRDFLVKILQTISYVLLWMMLNVFFGFYKNYAFFTGQPAWYNYLFYALSLAGLIMLVLYLIRKWKT